jgi:hypothetical protein
MPLRGASRTRVRDPGPEENHLPVLQGASQAVERERAGEMSRRAQRGSPVPASQPGLRYGSLRFRRSINRLLTVAVLRMPIRGILVLKVAQRPDGRARKRPRGVRRPPTRQRKFGPLCAGAAATGCSRPSSRRNELPLTRTWLRSGLPSPCFAGRGCRAATAARRVRGKSTELRAIAAVTQ